jgi:hypothetical protein
MPFKSEKQRRFMWSQHPEIAEKWAHGEHSKKKKKHKKHTMPRKDKNGFY